MERYVRVIDVSRYINISYYKEIGIELPSAGSILKVMKNVRLSTSSISYILIDKSNMQYIIYESGVEDISVEECEEFIKNIDNLKDFINSEL